MRLRSRAAAIRRLGHGGARHQRRRAAVEGRLGADARAHLVRPAQRLSPAGRGRREVRGVPGEGRHLRARGVSRRQGRPDRVGPDVCDSGAARHTGARGGGRAAFEGVMSKVEGEPSTSDEPGRGRPSPGKRGW